MKTATKYSNVNYEEPRQPLDSLFIKILYPSREVGRINVKMRTQMIFVVVVASYQEQTHEEVYD